MTVNDEEIMRQLLLDIEKLKAPEGFLYAGHPNYNTLFGRDSLISAWQMLPIAPEIAASTLRILAYHQAKVSNAKQDARPGHILHEYRLIPEEQQKLPHWVWPYYGAVDSTSLFMILLAEYVRKTDDIKLLCDLWPNVTMAMGWHIDNSKENKDGFITYKRQNSHGLFHQGWKDSPEDHLKIIPPVAIIETQGYAYLACKSYAFLYKRLGLLKPAHMQAVQELVNQIKANLHKFWMEDEQYFALAIDGNGNQRKAITSNPGHLLLAGELLDRAQAKAIIKRLFQKDLWSMGGIRTLSSEDPDFDPMSYHCGSIWPQDNWLVYTGCRLWGFNKRAQQIKNALLRTYITLDGIQECHAVVQQGRSGRAKIVPIKRIEQLAKNSRKLGRYHLASFSANTLQAWATGALLNMLFTKKNG